jgi:hypothetical protein
MCPCLFEPFNLISHYHVYKLYNFGATYLFEVFFLMYYVWLYPHYLVECLKYAWSRFPNVIIDSRPLLICFRPICFVSDIPYIRFRFRPRIQIRKQKWLGAFPDRFHPYHQAPTISFSRFSLPFSSSSPNHGRHGRKLLLRQRRARAASPRWRCRIRAASPCWYLNLSTSIWGTRRKVEEGGDRHDLEPEGMRKDARHKIYTGSGSRSSYPTSCLEQYIGPCSWCCSPEGLWMFG